MERPRTPAEGDDVSASKQLSPASGETNVRSLAARSAEVAAYSRSQSEGPRPVLPDLTVTREVKEHWEFGYHASVKVPVNVPASVSLVGIQKAINFCLAGRMPITYRSPGSRDLIALFRIADARPETMREIDVFAASMAKALGPMVVGEPTVEVTYFSEPLEVPSST